MVTFTAIEKPDGSIQRFQWAVARMVTFTGTANKKDTAKLVSVGCCPDGHFHQIIFLLLLSFGFQWAVARMVTFTFSSPIFKILSKFQWAVARMVTFTPMALLVGYIITVSVGCCPDGHFHP